MKFLLLSLVVFINAQPVIHTPFMDKMVMAMSDYSMENWIGKDPFSKPKEERVKLFRDHRIAMACIYVYCHFEHRNSCRNECEKFTKQWNSANNRTITPVFKDCNLSVIKSEKSCANDCVSASFKIDQTGKVCSALCTTLFSFSEKERQEFREGTEYFCRHEPNKFPLPWN